jgi:hypothetical protein
MVCCSSEMGRKGTSNARQRHARWSFGLLLDWHFIIARAAPTLVPAFPFGFDELEDHGGRATHDSGCPAGLPSFPPYKLATCMGPGVCIDLVRLAIPICQRRLDSASVDSPVW